MNFTGNVDGANNRKTFFIIEETKETMLDFLHGTVKVLRMSLYDLACLTKVFDHTACPTTLFCFNPYLGGGNFTPPVGFPLITQKR